MNAKHKFALAFLATSGLLLAAGASADVRINSVNADNVMSSNIALRGGDVVITASDDSVARVTPLGDLLIRNKRVAVTDDERKLLKQYSAGIYDIQQHGIEIGERAVNMVGGMVGTLVTDLLGGSDDRQMDRDMKAKAEPIREEALELCTTVKSVRHIQESLADELPAFRPYAVIDTDSEHDCHIDNDNDTTED